MKENFPRALARILVYEGGKVNDPRDPGGKTNKGITQTTFYTWLRRNGQALRDVYTITAAEVAAIYKTNFWDRIKGDELPSGVDITCFDGAVNSGVSQQGKWVQRALGITADGDFGQETMLAINNCADDDKLIADMLARRLGTLQAFKTWKTYGKGWSARISNVKKIGQAWATGSVGPAPVNVEALGGNQKADIRDIVPPAMSSKLANATAISGSVGTGLAQAAQSLSPLSDTITAVKYVFIAATIGAAAFALIAKVLKDRADAGTNGEAIAPVDDAADDLGEPVQIMDSPDTVAATAQVAAEAVVAKAVAVAVADHAPDAPPAVAAALATIASNPTVTNTPPPREQQPA